MSSPSVYLGVKGEGDICLAPLGFALPPLDMLRILFYMFGYWCFYEVASLVRVSFIAQLIKLSNYCTVTTLMMSDSSKVC